MKTSIYLIALLAFILVSCHSSKKLANMPTSEVSEQTKAGNADADQVITEKYWKLIELNGQQVSMGPQQPKEAHFILKNEDSHMVGNAGCNQFAGTYKLGENNRIHFSQVISTKMACMDMTLEYEFLKVLSTADIYSLQNDTLTLSKAQMAPLARFVAVYF